MPEKEKLIEERKGSKKVLYIQIAIGIIIIFLIAFFANAILANKSPDLFTKTFNKTITVKALSPTGSDLGLGIFATDETGYLSYPNDANITTGEKNITIGKTYDITYYYESKTRLRIISHIEENVSKEG
jgi:hypothetical protein